MSEWISIDERLPDDYEDVIAGNSYGVNFAWYDGESWLFPGDSVHGEVTHWQPLPEPPQ